MGITPAVLALFLAVQSINSGSTEAKRYAVLSPSCRMLELDPFDPSIVEFVWKMNSTSYETRPPLSSVSQAGRTHTLHLHEENFHHYKSDDPSESIDCEYNLIRRFVIFTNKSCRMEIDNNFSLGDPLPLKGDLTFMEDTEFVSVRCFLNGDTRRHVYVNMHAFIGFKEEVGKKISRNTQNPSKRRKMGVMIVGFDSMSRSSIQRNMPKTVQHLTRTGWFSLRGYNKIEDNTFPNVMAVLSGKSLPQLKETCWPNQLEHLDKCPIIWKDFSAKGYVTAYAEDCPGIGTFNCYKQGFVQPPTDYYMRPFMLAAQKFSREKSAYHVFNYSIDFAECFHRHPTFSLFWLNSFSHNDCNEPSTMDDDVLNYFERLTGAGFLDTTMVIFLSDHGLRVGPLRETYVGHVEDRQPFIYLWIPDWFKRTHPEKVWSLVINTNRLTSPYDIYMTLVDVLGENTTAEGCPGCRSLFKPVPKKRTCADAGITEHWCACNEYEDVPFNTSWAREMAGSVVDKVNSITRPYKGCAKLKLEKILSLKQRTFGATSTKSYIVTLQTTPGGAKFEATVARMDNDEDSATKLKKWKIFETVSRISLYGSESYCTNNYFAKEYCFCQ